MCKLVGKNTANAMWCADIWGRPYPTQQGPLAVSAGFGSQSGIYQTQCWSSNCCQRVLILYCPFGKICLICLVWQLAGYTSWDLSQLEAYKIKTQEVPPLKGKHKYSAYQETFTSPSEQALFSGFRMVGLTSRAAFTLITGLALQRKHPLEEHSTPH